ncbi:L-rhamnose mutarotase [Candidatus Poriferisocius sp.]|uniref:L-rhamnose mutarotase n=1 Tax=Candidatus Poriferisocius sp. TaxID=3101276 RepID=UPI003B019D7F
MRRFGQLIRIDPSRINEYADLHEDIWPEIVSALCAAGIRNYSIYSHDDWLFGYFEYHGPEDKFDQRMEELAKAPRMNEWWTIMGDMQRPLPDRQPGEFWKDMRCVFKLD